MNKKVLTLGIIIFIFLLLTTAGIFGYYYKFKKQGPFPPGEGVDKVLATVGDEKITQKDYNKRAFALLERGTPENPEGIDEYNKDSFLDNLIEAKVLRILAKEKNITIDISEEEIINDCKTRFTNFETADEQAKEAFKEASRDFLFKEKLHSEVIGWKEGKLLLYRYDRYLQVDIPENQKESLRNEKKEYAQKFAQQAYNRLLNKTSTYEEEKNKLLKDPIIGQPSWNPWLMTFFIEFNKENFEEESFVVGSTLKEKVLASSKGLSGPLTIDVLEDEETNKKVDGMYAIIIIDNEGRGGEVINFEDWLYQKIQEMKEKKEIVIYI